MTLFEMQQRLARRRGGDDTTMSDATLARYRDAINEAHKALLRQPGVGSLRYAPITLASVDGQQSYALPLEGVARIDRVWDPVNRRRLDYLTLSQVRERNPSNIHGTPYAYALTGSVEAHTQPSNASELFVKSTSASESCTAYLEGFVTGGYYRTSSVELSGLTAVSLTITTFIHITKFYLSQAALGTVTVHEDSPVGTELSHITIGRTRARFAGLLFEPVPATVITYAMDVLRAVPDMLNPTDEPLLPDDFHDLLVDRAELKELRKQDDPQRHAMLTRDITEGRHDLQTFVINHPDWRPQWAGSIPEPRSSQLGAWFPAGT